VSVFLPIVYLHGLASELFQEQAWTVAFSLVSSLAVAMTTVPMLASRMLRRAPPARASRASRLRPWVSVILDRKGLAFVGVGVALVLAILVMRTLQAEFIPREDQGLFHVQLTLPEGTRLEVTDTVARRASELVHEVGQDAVASVYAYVGEEVARNFGDATAATGPNHAVLSVSLARGHTRATADLLAVLDDALGGIPDLETTYAVHETSLESLIGGGGAPVEVTFSGDDLDRLRTLTDDLKARMSDLSSVYSVQTSFQDGEPEMDLALRLDVASSLGLTPESIVETLTRRLSGEEVGEIEQGQRTRTIRVGYDEVDLTELRQVRVDAPDGALLTVADLADPVIVEGPREILREDQRRIGRVSANIAEGVSLSRAIEDVERSLAGMVIPTGYRVNLGGEERERAESFESLKFALLLSVVLIYMVMASLFESFLHPFTVMLSLPLAGLGVVFTFGALAQPLSVMAYIGIIMLGGIAVNDAIILVDRINQIRRTAPTVREAVLAGVDDRVRPIMMTTATTILALLPMAVGVGEGAEMRTPMALAVIGGLVSSTGMTLFVIPMVYEVVESLRARTSL